MSPELQAHVAFHLTGKRVGAGLLPADGMRLRPGLLARFGDLTQLRYDFPLVLVAGRADESAIQSLSALVNGILQDIAPRGIEGEATRRRVLRLEREIRALAADGATGAVSTLWERAAERIGAPSDPALAKTLSQARAQLKFDGEVIDCTFDLPARLITHAWRALQRQKAERFQRELERLVVKLTDILQADFVRSTAGTSAARLKASVGTGMEDAFNFQALSSTLAPVSGKNPVPDSRRGRLTRALTVLKAHQSLVQAGGCSTEDIESCLFANCREALAAFRSRLPRIIDLVKAMAIAELETEGSYQETLHDPFFADFDESSVGAKDLGLFPDYLVCIDSEHLRGPDNSELMEILASGMPVKVVLRVRDVLEEPALQSGHLEFIAPAAQTGRMAMGLGNVYVLQASSAQLYPARRRILAGLAHAGPALFSVFAGAPRGADTVPPYLLAAGATQSRAFPAFSYDPAAGPDWATRFALDGNPQPEADWPVDEFSYEDEACQSVTERVAFTFADFVACDPRYVKHFAMVPRAEWNGSMVPVDSSVTGAPDAAGKVPYLQLVDGEFRMRRALIDEKLLTAARRCRETWRSLQELGGVRSSQADRLLVQERKRWEEQKQREIEALKREAKPATPTAPAAVAPAAPAAQPATAEAEPEKPSDEPYIETPRCTTCNECTNLNNRMFAYDDNKQAYIKDIGAGSYRELVEAAEACQVSIIHPGKPRNPSESGLDELIKRAEPFL